MGSMVRQETGDQRPMAGKKSGRVPEGNGKRVTVGSGMVLCAVGRVSRMRGVQDSASGAWERRMNGRPKVRAWATLAFAGSGAVAVHDAELPARGTVDGGQDGRRFCGDEGWEAGATKGFSRETRAAEFLGFVLRSRRCELREVRRFFAETSGSVPDRVRAGE